MNHSSRRLALAGTAALLVLTACGSPAEPTGSPSASATASPSASASATPAPSATPSIDLSAISVSDADTPVVTFKAPWAITATQSKVLRPSDKKQKVTEESAVTLNYLGVNGTTGKTFNSSYETGKEVTFTMDKIIPGLKEGLVGQAVGSRVLVGIPSKDAYPQGTGDGSINAGDTILFVADIISAREPEVVTPAAGLPTVTMTDDKPEITIPTGMAAPTELVVQPLIKGVGEAVAADSTVQISYRSWTFADGKLFQDAWQPQSGKLSSLIKGWQQGLVGQTVGSRVMLIVPPALAYPDGQPSATPSLAAGQTLVYVIDIVDAVAGS